MAGRRRTSRKRKRVNFALEFGSESVPSTNDRKFTLASQPSRISEVRDSLTMAQRSAINRVGFGGLLDMDYAVDQLGGEDFNVWLATRFRGEDSVVVDAGEPLFYLTPADVYHVFKLPLCPGNPVNEGENEEVSSIRKRWLSEYTFPVGAFKTKMKDVKKWLVNENRATDDFVRIFVAYALSCFLVPVANGKMDFRTLRSTVKVDEICNYDWCSFVLSKSCLAAARFNKEKKEGKPQISFSGCMVLLLISYLQRMEVPPVRNMLSVPFTKYWTQDRIDKRIGDISRLGGYAAVFKANAVTPLNAHCNAVSCSRAGTKSYMVYEIPIGTYADDHQIETEYPNVSFLLSIKYH